MKGRAGCPHCHGRGVVLDPSPDAPARICTCVNEAQIEASVLNIPARYRNTTLESFWEWWKSQHGKEKILAMLEDAARLLETAHSPMAPPMPEGLASKLEMILHKCSVKGSQGEWKPKVALEPEGFDALQRWAKQGRDKGDIWWLDGPPGSGRSSLASAALKAYCGHAEATGLFASVRTLGQELKDVYYDVRSFQNRDYMSERTRMEPLLRADFLVLDDFDRLDSDIRVVRAFAQLLDFRYAEERPTLITSGRWVETLLSGGAEAFPLARLEDPNLNRRLMSARRVVLVPTLERLMELV